MSLTWAQVSVLRTGGLCTLSSSMVKYDFTRAHKPAGTFAQSANTSAAPIRVVDVHRACRGRCPAALQYPGSLGDALGCLGALLGRRGALLDYPVASSGALGSHLGLSWGPLEGFLGRFWALLGVFWGAFWALFCNFSALQERAAHRPSRSDSKTMQVQDPHPKSV